MKITHILLVALAALALSLASIGVMAPAIAGGHATGGDFHAALGVTTPEPATAGGRVSGSDFHAALGVTTPEPTIAGGAHGIGGDFHAGLGGKMKDAPRITVSGGVSGGVVLGH
jgi:hypothetical protein